MYPQEESEERNLEFKNKYLLHQSYQKAFFGCRQNSYILMDDEDICAIGEIYLFIDGQDYLICSDNKKANIKKLNTLVNQYNKEKSLDLKTQIEKEIYSVQNSNIEINDFNLENKIVEKFRENEKKKNERERAVSARVREELKPKIEKLFTDSLVNAFSQDLINKMNQDFLRSLQLKNPDDCNEINLKIKLVTLIKQYGLLYKYKDADYLNDLYVIIQELVLSNPKVGIYFVDCFSLFYSKKAMKNILLKSRVELENYVVKKDNYQERMWKGRMLRAS